MLRIPSEDEFLRGVEAYEAREKRDPMYKVASFLIAHFWGRASDMADGLGVLLLTWNQAFYRYGSFDFDELENCLASNLQSLESFRGRDISSLSRADERDIKTLFTEFLLALRAGRDASRAKKSPVAVAKALHLLAPGFFPLWDVTIARAYGFNLYDRPSEKYVDFCQVTKELAEVVKECVAGSNRTLVKLVDEYNYSKFAKRWI